MAAPFDSIEELEAIEDFWNSNARSSHNNSVTDINIITRNDPLMPLESTQYLDPDHGHVGQTMIDNGMEYHGTSTVDTYRAPFLLADLNVDTNVGFGLDETTMLYEDIFESGSVFPCLLPRRKSTMPTERIQPKPRTNPTRRETTRNQTKRNSAQHTEEENTFIQNLRAQNIPWKRISELFSQRFGKVMRNSSLQMRMIRRRKRAGKWRYPDTKLLHEAYDYWETEKFAIIAAKLQELGASQTYTARQIEFQLQHSQHEWAKDGNE